MLDNLLIHFITALHSWPCELVEILSLLACALGLLLLWHLYGAVGLITYQALAIVVANIQVLQIAQFSFGPMALGNSLFATTFWGTYILTQRVSPEAANQSLMIGFWAQVGVTLFMALSLAHNPQIQTADAMLLKSAGERYQAISELFTPSLRIVIASLSAYYVSQKAAIWLAAMRAHSNAYAMFVMLIANVLDQFLFGFLAWILFSPEPVSWESLWLVYIVPAFMFRILANLLSPLVFKWSFKKAEG